MNIQAASDLINEKDHVSLTEACRAAGVERSGGKRMIGHETSNIWWAFDCTEEAVELVYALIRLGHGIEPVVPLVYMIDGEPVPLNMKMVGSRPPKTGYKKPRWTTVAFRKIGTETATYPTLLEVP